LVFEKADWNLKEVVDMNLEEKQIKHLFYQLMYGLKVSTLFSLRWITCEVLDCLFPLTCWQYLHQSNIAHRDLKPSNILVTKAGHIKVFFWLILVLGFGKGARK